MAGIFQINITHKIKDIMIPLYKALVRPSLEYAVSVWCPYKKKHIKQLEDVQRNFTKRIKGMKDLDYQERLKKLKLPSLMYRKIRGDMIEVFKILSNYYDPITTASLLTLHKTKYNLRTNNKKIIKKSFVTKKFELFFTNRVINLWNGLPSVTVKSKSMNAFKNNIDRDLKQYMYDGYIDITKIKVKS